MNSVNNRHGLIAGATGTGKTVSLQILAEGFSRRGVPVFMADVKGDLSGLSQPGKEHPKLMERAEAIGLEDYAFEAFPVVFWDLFGNKGHRVRATVSDMGPLLLARMLVLEQEGAKQLLGEPALELYDLIRTGPNGYGNINILAADKLMQTPKLYATFLLWLLSELFEELPEIGDPDKPRLVFFFDEAHLLFDDAPKALVEKVEQVVRLIRSKGVGVYFVTQNPLDIPDAILGQLGNRIQHALRAFTPRDQKAVRAAQIIRDREGIAPV